MVSQLVNPASLPVDAVVAVTFTCVGPIQNSDAAIRAISQINALKPRVAELNQIRTVQANIARAAAFEQILVDAAAVKIQRKKMAVIFFRPIVGQINHQAAVGMAAAEGVGIPDSTRIGPGSAGVPMIMIGRLVDESIPVRGQMFAKHSFVKCAWNAVPQMAYHRVDKKKFAVLVPIVAPRIGAALANDFEDFAGGMIAPYGTIELGPGFFGRSRSAD